MSWKGKRRHGGMLIVLAHPARKNDQKFTSRAVLGACAQ